MQHLVILCITAYLSIPPILRLHFQLELVCEKCASVARKVVRKAFLLFVWVLWPFCLTGRLGENILDLINVSRQNTNNEKLSLLDPLGEQFRTARAIQHS